MKNRDRGRRRETSAGVAAAAEVVAKDEKHLAAVEKVGSDFIPVVSSVLESGLCLL